MPEEGSHSEEAIELAKAIVKRLEVIPNGCSETFPLEEIDELKEEFGIGD